MALCIMSAYVSCLCHDRSETAIVTLYAHVFAAPPEDKQIMLERGS
jgi:hypothetical protein